MDSYKQWVYDQLIEEAAGAETNAERGLQRALEYEEKGITKSAEAFFRLAAEADERGRRLRTEAETLKSGIHRAP